MTEIILKFQLFYAINKKMDIFKPFLTLFDTNLLCIIFIKYILVVNFYSDDNNGIGKKFKSDPKRPNFF